MAQSPGLSPQLLAAYRDSEYALLEPGLVFRIGAQSAALDALLAESGAATAAFVTAANPRSQCRPAGENAAALLRLEKTLAYPFLRGEGRSADRSWKEPSLLVLGIPRREAEALGREHGQNAIVFVEKGSPPELVVLAEVAPSPARVVLDTNVWLDLLVFEDPGVAPLRAALEARSVEAVIDADCEAELVRVLGYRFYGEHLPAEKQQAALEECRRIATRVERAECNAPLPACRDPDDQKFLELALAARADTLVTKDDALLRLSDRGLPFRIVNPAKTL